MNSLQGSLMEVSHETNSFHYFQFNLYRNIYKRLLLFQSQYIMFQWVYSRLCCEIRPIFPQPYTFAFHQRSYQTNKLLFQSNQIRTTKYNVLNFLPKSIINQYQRLANLYFLIVAIISTIPDVSPLFPGLIWAPLVFVLMISIVKQMYEDYQRYSTDRQVNDQKETTVLRDGRIQIIKWKDLIVGDMCRVSDQQVFPADLILISSKDEDGVAYIETASLDGEQTSKIRYAFPQLNKKYRDKQIKVFDGNFVGDIPNAALSQFRGILQINGQRFAMNDSSQLLYRGAKLKNTEWIWGLVVYTGQCSKIMMNGQRFITKLSTLEKKLNYLLVTLLLFQIAVCLLISGLATNKSQLLLNSVYLKWPSNYSKGRSFVMNFLMFFVEFSSSIPISLIVTIQIAKTAQSYFIDFDQLMYSCWRKRKVYARVAALNEQLGQVEYVFCDKTGTLTKNLLTFHTAVVGNQHYQFEYSSQNKQYYCQKFKSDLYAKRNNGSSLENSQVWSGQHLKMMHDYLMCLLFCNSISTIQKDGKIIYQSQSPDELAFIQMAKSMDFVLLKRDKNSVKIQIKGKYQQVQIVERFPFTSQRKRMSVIVKWEDKYILFTKGADNIISERSFLPNFSIEQSVNRLSYSGLRILLVCMRILPQKDVQSMLWSLKQAGMNEREIILQEYASQFEKDLSIIGATGLLDELQEGVPQTLRDFQRAGIRTWMLTGDKMETAIQVAKSCNLIAPDYQIVLMRSSIISLNQVLEDSRQRISSSVRKHSLVIEGAVLNKIIGNQQNEKQFAQFTLFFMSVICCRMLPVQKSQVVGLVKRRLEKICLSIGDGGNDVSMIKQANIGVGIYGEEGMSAVQASDYAIPEFRMIWRLLFVHGRWNYMRISQLVLYFIYKSLIFTVPRFLFAFNNAYSGYPIYDDYYIALYNVVFTALPLLIRALMEQDVNYVTKTQGSDIMCKAEQKFLPSGYSINVGLRKLFPKIYYVGQKNEIFNLKECLAWIFQSIVMGVCTFYIINRTFDSVSITQNGINSNLHLISVTIFTAIIIIVTIKLCMQVQHWTKLLFFCITVLSILPYVGFMWVVNFYFNRPIQRILIVCFTNAKAYLTVIVLAIILIGINGLFVYIRFHSHRILKKMKIAIEEDIQMIQYFSSGSQVYMMTDEERKMSNKQMKKVSINQQYAMKVNYFIQS